MPGSSRARQRTPGGQREAPAPCPGGVARLRPRARPVTDRAGPGRAVRGEAGPRQARPHPRSPEVPLLLGRLLLPEGAAGLADGAAAAAALPGAFAQLAQLRGNDSGEADGGRATPPRPGPPPPTWSAPEPELQARCCCATRAPRRPPRSAATAAMAACPWAAARTRRRRAGGGASAAPGPGTSAGGRGGAGAGGGARARPREPRAAAPPPHPPPARGGACCHGCAAAVTCRGAVPSPARPRPRRRARARAWRHAVLAMAAPGERGAGGAAEEAFLTFYNEVKQIEKRDSVLTSKNQIDRLTRPGSSYFNLNPFEVLQMDPEATDEEIKKRFRQLSILVHPDKNQDDADRAQKAFEAVDKAYKLLLDQEQKKRALDVIQAGKEYVEHTVKEKKKQLKKDGKPPNVEEDDPEVFKQAVYKQTMKLFAELEIKRKEREAKEMHERKRQREEEIEAQEKAKREREWQKNFELQHKESCHKDVRESRDGRVDSWRNFQANTKGKKEKKNRTFLRPPKVKMEQRE
uniref:DnaJ homolog subfamily C member 8 n=1 Tax=Anser brachyrhynchus TaxID=132585 RepID=A0A8B9BUW3_9AVES